MKYIEIFRLKDMLEKAGIPFEFIEHKNYKNGFQICYPDSGEKRVCSVIEHSFSYGNEKDLLEISGLMTDKEQEEKGIELMRKEMGISGDATMGTSDGRIERVRIAEAKFFPKLPSYWKQTKVSIYNIISKDADEYIRSYDFNGLHVIVSPAKYEGTEWLHVSFSRKNRIPDYKDIQLVRKDFIGTDKKSIMVFPEESHYVNIAKYCLHLWYSAENPIPDFDAELLGMRTI